MGNYTTIDEMREEGLTEKECNDTRLTKLITAASKYIDKVTGCFFEPRALTLYMDPPRGSVLRFNVPIISIDSIAIVDEARTVEFTFQTTDYVVYNRHLEQAEASQEDKLNPKIEFVGLGGMRPHLRLTAPFGPHAQSVKVVGTFGWTDFDDTEPNGITPEDIVSVCQDIVIRNHAKKADFSRNRFMKDGHRLSSETQDGSLYVMERRGIGAFTSNMEIDNILARYRVPRYVG
jgi:hypothetical protein